MANYREGKNVATYKQYIHPCLKSTAKLAVRKVGREENRKYQKE
jgi:hypothetical protein